MAQPVTTALFWGEDEFLLRQAALQFLEERAAKATEVDAREWQGGEISDLSTPSLWGERRALSAARADAAGHGSGSRLGTVQTRSVREGAASHGVPSGRSTRISALGIALPMESGRRSTSSGGK